MLNGIENAYFNEFRRSEILYNLRDIRDHLTTVLFSFLIWRDRFDGMWRKERKSTTICIIRWRLRTKRAMESWSTSSRRFRRFSCLCRRSQPSMEWTSTCFQWGISVRSIVGAAFLLQLLCLLGNSSGVGTRSRFYSFSIACLRQTIHKTFCRSVISSTPTLLTTSAPHTQFIRRFFSASIGKIVTLIGFPRGKTGSHHCGLYVTYFSFSLCDLTINESRTGLCV